MLIIRLAVSLGLLLLLLLTAPYLNADDGVILNHAGFPVVDPPDESSDPPPFILPFANPPGTGYLVVGPGLRQYRWRIHADALTGLNQPLTNPTTLPFSIANGDWEVSPNGRSIIFVNSADPNIWLLTLP
ncbi:MAG: hypothetical protein JW953_04365 [Anaerolineae bacterium]|nr:hypothetical protein [Anaerolineae bacterium]